MESTTTTGTKGKEKTELQTGSTTTNMSTRFALCGGSRGHLRWTPSGDHLKVNGQAPFMAYVKTYAG